MKSEDKVTMAHETSFSNEKQPYDGEVSSGEVVPVETTKRGLKARHAQMIALGGTIGMRPVCSQLYLI